MIDVDILKENSLLTINELLNTKEENFEMFKFFFDRVLELCEREAGKKNIEEYANGLKCFTLKEVEEFLQSQKIYSSIESSLNISSNVFSLSLAVIFASYKFCFYQKPIFIMIGMRTAYDMQHILSALFVLEDITANKHTAIVHKYFLNKYLESEKKKKSEMAKKAAQIKHAATKERDKNNLKIVKDIWDSSNWKSYTACAEHIFKEQLINDSNYRKIFDLVSKAAKSKK